MIKSRRKESWHIQDLRRIVRLAENGLRARSVEEAYSFFDEILAQARFLLLLAEEEQKQLKQSR